MKDSVTGETIVIEIDNEYGPYVQVTDFEDYDYLEDELAEKFGIEPFAIKPIEKEGEMIAYRSYLCSTPLLRCRRDCTNKRPYRPGLERSRC